VRIGVNALYLIPGKVGGTEIYLRSLLKALASVDTCNEYLIYANFEADAELAPASPRFRLIRCHVKASFRPWRMIYEQVALPFLLAADKVDAIFNPGFTGPALCCRPSITVFHDLQHRRFPEFFRWHERPFWRFFLWLAARHSKRIIAVSQATRRDLLLFYPFTQTRITVIPHGVDPEFFEIGVRRGSRPRSFFVLAVATIHPHKNLERLIDAFAHFRQRRPAYRLVIAGLRGNASKQVEMAIHRLNCADAVEITGWISRSTLYNLFEEADAFITASIFEGFGMPILEALAAGIPCGVSRIPVFGEVAADAALCFDPFSTDDIARVLLRLADDEEFRSRARTYGPQRARRFRWECAAQRIAKEMGLTLTAAE